MSPGFGPQLLELAGQDGGTLARLANQPRRDWLTSRIRSWVVWLEAKRGAAGSVGIAIFLMAVQMPIRNPSAHEATTSDFDPKAIVSPARRHTTLMVISPTSGKGLKRRTGASSVPDLSTGNRPLNL